MLEIENETIPIDPEIPVWNKIACVKYHRNAYTVQWIHKGVGD